jgi:hypothetical protein
MRFYNLATGLALGDFFTELVQHNFLGTAYQAHRFNRRDKTLTTHETFCGLRLQAGNLPMQSRRLYSLRANQIYLF